MSKHYDILVVDDEQVIIDAVVKICSAESLNVDSAIDAKIALNKLTKNTYRLIICDIMLPEMDGFAILEEIFNRKIGIPVVMTTGYSTVENAVKSLHNGAIDFIPKPFTADELVSSVYRGLKFADIHKSFGELKSTLDNTSIIYVPCLAKYHRLGHTSWIDLEHTGSALIGVLDLFIKTIEPIEDIELFALDDEIIQGNLCARLETKDDLIHNILSPVSGRIIERNESLMANPNIIEKDPYFKGWIYRIIPSAIEYELKHLTSCSSDRM